MVGRLRLVLLVAAVLGGLLVSSSARGVVTVQDLVRLEGYGASELWGVGLVTGLAGTGDGGEVLPMARPLAKLLERGANPIPDLDELAASNSVALVLVTVRLPERGVKKGDVLDADVQTMLSASSLEGGRLFLTMLTGPLPGQGVYATASGRVVLEGTTGTSGRVRGGARMVEDVEKPVVSAGGEVRLNVLPRYGGWPTADLIASTINQDAQGLFLEGMDVEPIARAVDERTVAVEIPDADLSNPSAFISSMLTITLDETLLELPARVVINEEAGSIVLTGNVTISPAVVSHRGLVVTTVTPEREPNAVAPRVERDSSVAVGTAEAGSREMARAADLLDALRALDVPVGDQIVILKQLHRGGQLHGELIYE
jgi:flagellar P-ring protein precursor FlgI